MTDLNDIDKLLARAKIEADNFFADYSNERIKKDVYSRIRDENNKEKLSIYDNVKKKYNSFNKIKAPAITAIIGCTLLLLIGFSGKLFSEYNNQGEVGSLGDPVSQETIKLDKSDSSQLLDYFQINNPNKAGDSLLAVIWDSHRDGHYEMAYSSLFENSDQPLPILMIYFPQNQPDMAVISSQNNDLQHLHYRVLGYRQNRIITLMEQNYINGGEIEVLNGVLKETRFIPGNTEKVVTHYIPYQSNDSGDIIPSLQNININIGEYIAFIGDIYNPIEVSYPDLFSEWEGDLINQSTESQIFYAENIGHEELSIKPLNGGNTITISVKITEDE